MRSGWSRHTTTSLAALARASLLVAGLALGGCQTDGAPFAETATGSAVAFDRIEGPPRTTFDQLVAQLGPAADAHQVRVVSRQTDAPYRVKGYLSLQKDGSRTAVAYAWDVFDKDGARITRLTGQEPLAVPRGASDPWVACDEGVIEKIADRTMADSAQTVSAGPSATAASPAPPASGAAQAALEGVLTRSAFRALPTSGEGPQALAYATR